MFAWLRNGVRGPREREGERPRLVVVTYMTRGSMGVCRLRDPRWCYRDGRLALAGERHAGDELAFDFDQILTLETVPEVA